MKISRRTHPHAFTLLEIMVAIAVVILWRILIGLSASIKSKGPEMYTKQQVKNMLKT